MRRFSIWRLEHNANDPRNHRPSIGLYREKWKKGKGYPRAMVCFEWEREKSDFREGYVGISDRGENACQELKRLLKENPEEFTWFGPQWKQTKMWPAFRYITPPDHYSTQLPTFRKQIADEIIQLWNDCHALLEKTLNS